MHLYAPSGVLCAHIMYKGSLVITIIQYPLYIRNEWILEVSTSSTLSIRFMEQLFVSMSNE